MMPNKKGNREGHEIMHAAVVEAFARVSAAFAPVVEQIASAFTQFANAVAATQPDATPEAEPKP